jgi:hypothetical protein
MRRLITATAIILLAAGCSGEQTPNTPTPTTQSATVTTSHTPAGPPPLEPTAQQWVNDSNTNLGGDYTNHIRKYATPDCADFILSLDDNTDQQPTRLVSVNQTGTTGTTVTALRDDPTDTGSTVNWTYLNGRWQYTCDGIFG